MQKHGSEDSSVDVSKYWNTVRHHKWLVLYLTVGLTILAVVPISMLPNHYQAWTTILVDPQRVPDDASATGPGRAGPSPLTERLRSITQEVLLSAPRLQGIIAKYHLEPELRETAYPPIIRSFRPSLTDDDIIEAIRKRIEVTVKQGGAGAPATVNITYEGLDPAGSAQVANDLATQLIAWNVESRKQQTSSSVEFLRQQLEGAKKDLDDQEKTVRDFKLGHAGEMPGELQTSLQTLAQLRTMYQANSEALNRLSQEYIDLTKPGVGGASSSGRSGAPLTGRERLQEEINQLREKRTDLLKHYTPTYPEVVDVETHLRLLTQQLNELPEEKLEAGAVVPASSPNAARIEMNHRTAERLQEEQKRLGAQIADYQRRVDAVPVREQQLNELTRNYTISKQDYQTLFQKREAAEMAASLEMQQGENRFVVLDQARVPERPFKPNRPVLTIGAFLGSLALSLGLVLAKEQLRATVTTEDSLRGFLPDSVAVIASIPAIESPSDVSRRRTHARVAVAVLVVACVLVVVLLRTLHSV